MSTDIHPTGAPDILDISQAATMLGMSEKSIRRHLKEIPHRRIGLKILFSRELLIEYVRGASPKKLSQPRASHPKADF